MGTRLRIPAEKQTFLALHQKMSRSNVVQYPEKLPESWTNQGLISIQYHSHLEWGGGEEEGREQERKRIRNLKSVSREKNCLFPLLWISAFSFS